MRIFLITSLLIILFSHCENKSGTYVTYYNNGDTLSVYNYVNDSLHGFYKEFFGGHKPKEIGTYEKGFKMGIIKQYYENGTLKSFAYYKYSVGMSHYEKKFDNQGNIIGAAIPIGKPNRMLLDTIDANEPFRIGYTLDYSMYERPRLFMTVINTTDNKNDTLVRMGSDTTIVEYDLQISKGWNQFTVELCEYTAASDTIKGMQTQELKYFGK